MFLEKKKILVQFLRLEVSEGSTKDMVPKWLLLNWHKDDLFTHTQVLNEHVIHVEAQV